jgi:hypothetical protein
VEVPVGRVGMALTVLEGLTGLVDGALLEAMAKTHARGRRGESLLQEPKAPVHVSRHIGEQAS